MRTTSAATLAVFDSLVTKLAFFSVINDVHTVHYPGYPWETRKRVVRKQYIDTPVLIIQRIASSD